MEIFAASGESFFGKLDDQFVIGNFSLMLPVALGEIVILAARFFDLVEEQEAVVVAKIDAAGILTCDRVEEIFTKGHSTISEQRAATQLGSVWTNSRDLISRNGISLSSTNQTLCPEGYCFPSSSAAHCVTRPSQVDWLDSFHENG